MENKNQVKDKHYFFFQTIGEHYILSIEKSCVNAFVSIFQDKNDEDFTIAYGVKNTEEGEIYTAVICHH